MEKNKTFIFYLSLSRNSSRAIMLYAFAWSEGDLSPVPELFLLRFSVMGNAKLISCYGQRSFWHCNIQVKPSS